MKHGAHVVSTTVGSNALIGVYSYGHSTIDSSSGAYRYTVAFKGNFTLIIRSLHDWPGPGRSVVDELIVRVRDNARKSTGAVIFQF